MNLLQDRRVLIGAGAAAAIAAGALIAVFLAPGRGAPPPVPTTGEGADRGRLQVELGEQVRLAPDRKLRCFVAGRLVGEATLADCAKRNGVAAQALDVGLDESGALSARSLAPAPPAPATPAPPPTVAAPAPAPAAPTAECLRYGSEGWRPAGPAGTLSACIQTLFAGRCQQAGQALYGRWGSQSLRLVPGRVETSGDNRDFRPLVDQARDCSIPAL